MTIKKLTKEQVQKKYYGKYIDIYKVYDYTKSMYLYEVRKSYKEIHENTTLGQDVGTNMEYCR